MNAVFSSNQRYKMHTRIVFFTNYYVCTYRLYENEKYLYNRYIPNTMFMNYYTVAVYECNIIIYYQVPTNTKNYTIYLYYYFYIFF